MLLIKPVSALRNAYTTNPITTQENRLGSISADWNSRTRRRWPSSYNQNGDEYGRDRADDDEGGVVKQRVAGHQPCVARFEQETEIVQPAPVAAEDPLEIVEILESQKNAEHRQIVVDQQVQDTRRRDQQQRPRFGQLLFSAFSHVRSSPVVVMIAGECELPDQFLRGGVIAAPRVSVDHGLTCWRLPRRPAASAWRR